MSTHLERKGKENFPDKRQPSPLKLIRREMPFGMHPAYELTGKLSELRPVTSQSTFSSPTVFYDETAPERYSIFTPKGLKARNAIQEHGKANYRRSLRFDDVGEAKVIGDSSSTDGYRDEESSCSESDPWSPPTSLPSEPVTPSKQPKTPLKIRVPRPQSRIKEEDDSDATIEATDADADADDEASSEDDFDDEDSDMEAEAALLAAKSDSADEF
jgi:hypothetical protein